MKTRVKAMWGKKIEKELTPKCIFKFEFWNWNKWADLINNYNLFEIFWKIFPFSFMIKRLINIYMVRFKAGRKCCWPS